MMRRCRASVPAVVVLAALLVCSAPGLRSQSRPLVASQAAVVYQRLLSQIERIKIFDHHAHPGFVGDPEVDPGTGADWTLPLRLREQDTDWVAAARVLFAFPYRDLDGAHGKWLTDKKTALKRSRPGAAYFDAILDRLGIETSVANRITMPDYLNSARFKWVFYADPVMYAFDNSGMASVNPDLGAYMPNETKLLQRFEQQAGLRTLPDTLAGYLQFVSQVLEDHRRRGAIAAKFEVAYFRSFVFDDPPQDAVTAVYDKYKRGGVPTPVEYKRFQDFVFRYILAEAGRMHMPVHIHSSAGAGNYFSLSGANVVNLESVLHDPRFAATTFVLIHGGWPFDEPAILMTLAKNVWLDTSATGSFILYPDEFARVLRRWFEISPDKVTFGSDAFPIDDRIGAEEMYWIAVNAARTAAAAALAEMVVAREITESYALTVARGYLHDTAATLYR